MQFTAAPGLFRPCRPGAPLIGQSTEDRASSVANGSRSEILQETEMSAEVSADRE